MKNIKINNIRALAIIIVVLGHSIILYSSSWGFYSTIYNIPFLDNLKNIINIIQMPLFFSLSGYLFYNTIKKKNNFLSFVKNKIKRLIIPFFSIALFWMIPIKLIVKYNNYMNKNILSIMKELIIGYDAGHLWYLSALFIIFIIMYFICKYFLESKVIHRDILIFILLSIISLYASILFQIPCIKSAMQYMLFFYIGYIFKKYEIYFFKSNHLLKILLSIISIILIILDVFYIKSDIFNLFVILILLFTIYYIIPDNKNFLLDKISKNSFGIYLFHSPLIYFTYSNLANSNPIIVIFLNFVIFGFVAYYLTEFIRKTKLKFIIGE